MLPFILLGFVVAIAVILIGRSYTSRHITKYSREEADERVASGKALYLDVRHEEVGRLAYDLVGAIAAMFATRKLSASPAFQPTP